VTLKREIVDDVGDATIFSGYLYIDDANPSWPRIGDIRVSYSFTPPSLSGLVIGELHGDTIKEFAVKRESVFMTRTQELLRYYATDKLESALEQLSSEHTWSIWICRCAAVVMGFVGIIVVGDAEPAAAALWSIVGATAVVWIVELISSVIGFLAIVGAVVAWCLWMAAGEPYAKKSWY
jgi:hypothetical protein